jgi:hypothetical protein
MPETYKILGQVATSDTTEKVLYTSPAGTQALITNITAVNRTNTSQTFDVNIYNFVVSDGTTSTPLNNLYKDAAIQSNSFEILEPGIVLGAQNSIVVRGTADTIFSAYGVELS